MEMIRIDAPAELDMPIGEAMFTQRAIRRLDPSRPIAQAHLKIVLDAASKAPSGGNTQPARFLVVTNRESIREFGKLYHEAWWAKRRDEYGWTGKEDIPAGSVYEMPSRLADEIVDAPAVVLAFSVDGGQAAHTRYSPRCRIFCWAARALGIGSVLTTLHPQVMERVYSMFGIPREADFHCCIPLGYPRGRFGPTRRLPTSETTSWERWNAKPPWA